MSAGLTQETVTKDYSEVLQQKSIELSVLNIKDHQQDMLMDKIKSLFSTITSNNFKILDVQDKEKMPVLVADLMIQAFNQILQKAAAKHQHNAFSGQADLIQALSFSSEAAGRANSTAILQPSSYLNKDSGTIGKLQAGLEDAYLVSKPAGEIPFLLVSQAAPEDLSNQWLSVSPESLSGAVNDLSASHEALLASQQMLGHAAEAWQAAVSRVAGQIDDFAEALGDIVFPINCHTRRCGDLSGASLHLPGLIKALCTDFAYKKIFSAKKAGGRREYSIALVVDISTSMQGHLAVAAIETLVCMISALVQIGIDNFAIVTFGQQVRLLKACSMPWDAASIHLLLSSLQFDVECATFDANAIVLTTRLLENFGVKGPRTMFVISDGYGISGPRLAQVDWPAARRLFMITSLCSSAVSVHLHPHRHQLNSWTGLHQREK